LFKKCSDYFNFSDLALCRGIKRILLALNPIGRLRVSSIILTMSTPSSPQGSFGARPSWQDRLNEHCRRAKIQLPVFNIVSDRRGGRTAWSSTVNVSGRSMSARYWYAGEYIFNAREDAAEVALKQLNSQAITPTSYQGQLFPQQNGLVHGTS